MVLPTKYPKILKHVADQTEILNPDDGLNVGMSNNHWRPERRFHQGNWINLFVPQ